MITCVPTLQRCGYGLKADYSNVKLFTLLEMSVVYFYNSCIQSIDVGSYNENSSFSTQTKKKQDHAYAHIIRNNSFKNNTEASKLVDDYLLKITM